MVTVHRLGVDGKRAIVVALHVTDALVLIVTSSRIDADQHGASRVDVKRGALRLVLTTN
jgi:hypothetical protein